MGKDSPSPPPAPDYTGAAQATSQGSVQASLANNLGAHPNIYTPLGSQTWQQTGSAQVPGIGGQPGFDVPQYSQYINLSPQQQNLMNQQMSLSTGLLGLGNDALSRVQQSLSGSGNNMIQTPTGQSLADYGNSMQGGNFDGGPGSWATASRAAGGQAGTSGTQTPSTPWAPTQMFQGQTSGHLNTNDISSLYQDYLGRAPDQAGLQNWENNAAVMTPAQLEQAFSQSQEAQNYAASKNSQQSQPMASQGSQGSWNPVFNMNALANQAYQAQTSRLDPQWQQAMQQQQTQLANQGVTPGSQAYDNAMRVFNQGQNDAYTQARMAAIQTMPQTYQLDVAQRMQPLTEFNAIRSGAQPQMPQFQPVQYSMGAQGPNYLGASQAQAGYGQGIYNQQMAQQNAMTGGLFGLGGSLGAAMLGSPTGLFGMGIG